MDNFLIDVPSIVASLGIEAKNMAGRLKARCPFHDEKTPSWYIETEEPYRFNCFGCGESGTIFSLYFRMTGRSFYKDYGINQESYSFFTAKSQPRVFGEIRSRKIDSIDGALLLPYDNQEVMNYLLSRNTKEPISREFLDYYGIKYTIQAEINRPKDSKERGTFFNHRLTVPIIENKVLVGLEGRSYNGGSPKVLYPKNSCVDTLLNIDNLNPDEPLYLAEGVFHLPSLFNTGRRNISCTFGASVSAKQISILKKFKEIIYFPDNDDAGERAIETIIKGLNKDSLFICKLPYILNDKGKALDLGDFTAEEIDNFLLNVIPYNDYNYDKVDPFDRKDEISPGKVFLNSLDK